MSPVWAVWRHGGRATDQWRCIYQSHDEERARAHYLVAAEKLRQGRVELREYQPTISLTISFTPEPPDEQRSRGRLLDTAWGPCLRMRW